MTEAIREVNGCRLIAGALNAQGLYNVRSYPILNEEIAIESIMENKYEVW